MVCASPKHVREHKFHPPFKRQKCLEKQYLLINCAEPELHWQILFHKAVCFFFLWTTQAQNNLRIRGFLISLAEVSEWRMSFSHYLSVSLKWSDNSERQSDFNQLPLENRWLTAHPELIKLIGSLFDLIRCISCSQWHWPSTSRLYLHTRMCVSNISKTNEVQYHVQIIDWGPYGAQPHSRVPSNINRP